MEYFLSWSEFVYHLPHLGHVLFVLGHVGGGTDENCPEVQWSGRLYIQLCWPGGQEVAGLDTEQLTERKDGAGLRLESEGQATISAPFMAHFNRQHPTLFSRDGNKTKQSFPGK